MKAANLRVCVALALLVGLVLASGILVAEAIPEIPPNTTIRVRMIDRLSSEDTEVGDIFHGTLDEPIMANGRELYPKGSDVSGRVSDVHHSGRLSEPGELDLVLTTISSGHVASSIAVQPLVIKGESHTKSNATKIGGGAALGALIGAVAGGGKGAAIGTVAGGAAGTGAAAATGKKAAVVESEAVLAFSTSSTSSTAANSSPSPSADAAAQSNRDQEPRTQSPSNTTNTQDSVANNPAPPSSGEEEAQPLFTLRDRRIIRTCVDEHASDFPADLLHRPELPFGSERDLKRGGTLPTDASEKAKSLPLDCVTQLPKLSPDLDRVIYNGRVLLINSRNHIIDMFDLEESGQ
jgi:hypothetical protein